jgi:hypothetical protein
MESDLLLDSRRLFAADPVEHPAQNDANIIHSFRVRTIRKFRSQCQGKKEVSIGNWNIWIPRSKLPASSDQVLQKRF